MITLVCRNLNNVFNIDSGDFDEYEIKGEVLTSKLGHKYLIGSYIAIERRGGAGKSGSILNSGVYKVTDDLITIPGSKDEKWEGYVFQCAIPSDLIELAQEIELNIKNTKQNNKTSENFGIYSYSKATNRNGVVASWSEVFATRLSAYRSRMFDEVRL